VAFAFECGEARPQAWEEARAALGVTGRWPLLVWEWDGLDGPGWLRRLADDRIRLRAWQAELRYATGDHTLGRPEFVMTIPTPEAALADRRRRFEAEVYDASVVAAVLSQTERDYGQVPTPAELRAACGDPAPMLVAERWLLDWELAHEPLVGPPLDGHLDGGLPSFRDRYLAVVLLPVANGWDVLVHRSFPSGGALGSVERLMAVVRSWHERFGAELFAHTPTTAHFVVEHPPQTIDEAWPLAIEQYAVAPDTLQLAGVPLRRHAQALVGRESWFLHDKP
jgi:hypothetical protein